MITGALQVIGAGKSPLCPLRGVKFLKFHYNHATDLLPTCYGLVSDMGHTANYGISGPVEIVRRVANKSV